MHNNQLQRKDFIERKKSLCSKLLKRQKLIVLCVIFPTDVGWLLNLLWPEQLSVAFYYSFPFPHFCFSIFKSVGEYKRTLDFVVLAICFLCLLCWNIQPWPIFIFLAEGRSLLSKILLYMAPSIGTSMQCHVVLAENPQSIIIHLRAWL